MPQKLIFVKVEDISVDENGVPTENHGTVRVITWKAYQYTKDKFKLIAEVTPDGVDKDGNEIYKTVPGNPNLPAEYQTQAAPQSVAAHAVDAGAQRRGRPKRQEQELKEETA